MNRASRTGRPVAVVLFDIDGTLLLSGGAGRAAFRTAAESVFGTRVHLDGYEFHGKTDPQIAVELLGAAGLEADGVRARMFELWPVYLEALEHELESRRRAGRVRALPGVTRLLSELRTLPGVVLGLLTGNIEPAARLKLMAADLETEFAVGGFGSDAEARADIARVAVRRARESLRDGAQVPITVVGDTPADVRCARSVGGRAVAVATGRHGSAELRAAGADEVFEDFRDTGMVVKSFFLVDA